MKNQSVKPYRVPDIQFYKMAFKVFLLLLLSAFVACFLIWFNSHDL